MLGGKSTLKQNSQSLRKYLQWPYTDGTPPKTLYCSCLYFTHLELERTEVGIVFLLGPHTNKIFDINLTDNAFFIVPSIMFSKQQNDKMR